MIPHRILTSIAIASLAGAAPLAAQRRSQTAPAPPGWIAFTRAFDAFAAGDSIVGASTLIMRDGRVLGHHEYGMADRERREAMTDRAIFHWASITKTLTAIAIMQLRDRGKLSLEEMWRSVVPVEGLGESVGLSFSLFPKEGATMLVGHEGEQAGFRSFIYFNPQTSTAVIGAVNTTNEVHPDASGAAWIAITRHARTLLTP